MSKESIPVTSRSATECLEEIRVVHLDDDSSILDLTQEFLERADERITVTPLSEPEAAIDYLQSADPHCVISDYDMPETDGLELYEQLHDCDLDYPFILFTGKGSESIAAEAMSAGVTDYIQKGGTDTYDVLANRVLEAARSRQRKVVARQAVDHYNALVETSHLPVYHYNASGEICYANEAAVDLFGAESVAELVGEEMFDFHPPDDRSEVKNRVEQLRQGERLPPTELRFTTGEGADRIAKVSCAPTAFDDDAVGQTIAHDVTELQENERELELLREIVTEEFKGVDAGLWKHEVAEDRIARYGVASLLGVDDDTLSDDFESFLDHVHPEDRDTLEEAYVQASDHGEPFSVRFRTQTCGDDVRYLEDRGNPITDDEGRVTQVIGVVVDVTDDERRRRRLERQRKQFESIATTLSHDFRSPLGTLKGRLELARHGDNPVEQIDRARSITDRLEELVDGLARTVRAGKPVTDLETVGVDSIAVDAAHARSFPRENLAVEVSLNVEADPDDLRQLFGNLLGNALEHAGDDVTVEIGRLSEGFYVEDDGSGIPAEVEEDPFEFGVTTSPDGTGIGLASARQIAQSHGWEIEAVDADGARFEVTGLDVQSTVQAPETASQ